MTLPITQETFLENYVIFICQRLILKAILPVAYSVQPVLLMLARANPMSEEHRVKTNMKHSSWWQRTPRLQTHSPHALTESFIRKVLQVTTNTQMSRVKLLTSLET